MTIFQFCSNLSDINALPKFEKNGNITDQKIPRGINPAVVLSPLGVQKYVHVRYKPKWCKFLKLVINRMFCFVRFSPAKKEFLKAIVGIQKIAILFRHICIFPKECNKVTTKERFHRDLIGQCTNE